MLNGSSVSGASLPLPKVSRSGGGDRQDFSCLSVNSLHMSSPLNDEVSTPESILTQAVVRMRTSWLGVSKEWEGGTPECVWRGVGMLEMVMAWLKGSLWSGRDNGSLGVGGLDGGRWGCLEN